MTNPDITTDDADTELVIDLDAPPAAADDHDDDKAPNQNAENAAWRRKYADQKAVTTTQSALIERFQRSEISRLAAARLADPEDLWVDIELADLVGEEGDVDPALVGLQLDALLAKKPHYARKARPGTPSASMVTGDGQPPAGRPEAASWDQVLHDAAGSRRKGGL